MNDKRVNKNFSQFKKGDWVKAIWLDAATTKNVPRSLDVLRDLIPLEKQTPGQFIGVFKDPKRKFEHLFLVTEKSNHTWDVTTIPLAVVIDVVRISRTEGLKAVRSVERRIRYYK